MGPKKIIISLLASILIVFSFTSLCHGRLKSDIFQEFVHSSSTADDNEGTKWALLVAGSKGYFNYRHQAGVCHAYQILKNGGLKDENIIVFMYDDIAHNQRNPRKGVIINKPGGDNVYLGVPKDYTRENVTSHNFYNALLGNRARITGGSRKVLETGADDHIFIYYADHGDDDRLGMPAGIKDAVKAEELIRVLHRKFVQKAYKRMVIYVEACHSGSMFRKLPRNWNIYALTSSNAFEKCYATYCTHAYEAYGTCVGDLFSVSWMEDSENHDPTTDSLGHQFVRVRYRVRHSDKPPVHVMQYGDLSMSKDERSLYMGPNYVRIYSHDTTEMSIPMVAVELSDAELMYYKENVARTSRGSMEREVAQRELDEVLSHRRHVDESIEAIGVTLFGKANSTSLISNSMVRPAGQADVDDWKCFKTLVQIYEAHCGLLRTYGKQYLRAFANFCNAGINREQMAQASMQACA